MCDAAIPRRGGRSKGCSSSCPEKQKVRQTHPRDQNAPGDANKSHSAKRASVGRSEDGTCPQSSALLRLLDGVFS
eukprot:4564582-Prymnesium_polylepis.1